MALIAHSILNLKQSYLKSVTLSNDNLGKGSCRLRMQSHNSISIFEIILQFLALPLGYKFYKQQHTFFVYVLFFQWYQKTVWRWVTLFQFMRSQKLQKISGCSECRLFIVKRLRVCGLIKLLLEYIKLGIAVTYMAKILLGLQNMVGTSIYFI